MSGQSYHYDVIITGAGPAGLAAAYLLGREGLKVAVFEKRATTTHLPKGQAVMSSTAELFRQWGIWDYLSTKGWPTETSNGQGFYINVANGAVATARAIEGTHEDYVQKWAKYSPAYPRKIPASDYEASLRTIAEQFSNVQIHFSTPVVKAEHRPKGVAVTVKDLASRLERQVTATFAVVTDGAHSLVREQLGSGQDHGPAFRNQVLTEFEADLDDTLGKDGFFHSFILDPRFGGWFGSKHPDTGYWRYNFKHDEEVLPTQEFVLERIRGALGMPDLPITLKACYRFDYSTGLVRNWREGNFIFAGDAVHWHTPWGGLGMNSSIQDVHNLAWKLTLVIKGRAGERLLDSYQVERRSKALRTVKQATYNAMNFQAIAEAVRVGEPQLLARGDLSEEAREFLQDKVNQHTANSIGHIGYQLGTTYTSSAVVADGDAPKEQILSYVESTTPGVRLPHAWLTASDGTIVSTRDLANGKFVVIVRANAEAWACAIEDVRGRMGLTIELVAVSGQYRYQGDDKFHSLFSEDLALVVRPDGYIASRVDVHTNAMSWLVKTIGTILSISTTTTKESESRTST